MIISFKHSIIDEIVLTLFYFDDIYDFARPLNSKSLGLWIKIIAIAKFTIKRSQRYAKYSNALS